MTKKQIVDRIAREMLDIETLETRKMDNLDFHDVAVWQVAKALAAAYEAGQAAAPPRAKRTKNTTPRPRP